MSKQFKSQASSARIASNFAGFGTFQTAASPLSYIAEQPDLSQINEPNVVVSLKNLGKKDSTTKAKALDELLESLKENADVAVLTAWSDLYPRTSIDNSQIVRRSAHTLQGILTTNAGKSIGPLLPKLVPSWLAGTLDSDKSVARAASDALDKSFPTEEKKAALWKIFKDSIYSRVEDAILVQTATTLSDERTTSTDEAQSKFVRVVGTAIRLLGQLIMNGLDKYDILQEKKLWEFAYHDDAYLRTSACGLLRIILSKSIRDLDWTLLSICFVYKGLNKSQMGSAQAFVIALYDLTRARPSIWTSDYTSKTSAAKRLTGFLRQGSQNGPSGVWSGLASLIEHAIPVEAWEATDEDCDILADAYRSGVSSERVHTDAAWASYMDVTAYLLKQLETQGARDTFAERNLKPAVTSYVTGSVDEKWKLGISSESTARRALLNMSGTTDAILQSCWTTCADNTIEKMRLSLPESSKDFRKSQDGVAAQAKRLLSLQKASAPHEHVRKVNQNLLSAAIDLLRSRNGKPYGAAIVLQELVRNATIDEGQLQEFLEQNFQSLLDSPSSVQLVSLAMTLQLTVGQQLLSSTTTSPNTVRASEYFLLHTSEKQLEDENLLDAILKKIDSFETEVERGLALSVLANSYLQSTSIKSQILTKLTETLGSSTQAPHALSMLEVILSQPALSREISSSHLGSDISIKLLLLADSESPAADRANAIMTSLTSSEQSSKSSLPIIKQQLAAEGERLSILTLAELGLRSIDHVDIVELLPTIQDWQKALQPHLYTEVQKSLSVTSALHGAVWSIEAGVHDTPLTRATWSSEAPNVVRDVEDFSQLFRLAFYVVKVLGPNIKKFNALLAVSGGDSPYHGLYQWLPIALELINEKLTLDDANDIWLGSTDEVLQAASDVLSEGHAIIRSWFNDEVFAAIWLDIGSKLEETDRCTYVCALSFERIISELLEVRKSQVLQKFRPVLDATHRSSSIVQSSALLSALGVHLLSTQTGLKIVNELISHITQSPDDLVQLVLINVLLRGDTTVLEKVPQQRLVFLFKRLVAQVESPRSAAVLSEALVLISSVVPCIQDIYGEHWETLVQGLGDAWTTVHMEDVSLINSSLQVYSALRSCMKSEEVNDDLQEAWTTNKESLDRGLVHCLQVLGTSSVSPDQPRSITAESLRQRLVGVSVPSDVDLFALLSSSLPSARRAAFDLLHRSIPEKQEELSIDLALEDKLAQLPQELLHLIEDTTDAQRYLLSWTLVFDHYPKASFKLREAYSANLKASGAIPRLLDFLCDKFRITSGRPIDASKFDIKNDNHDLAESNEENNIPLCVHTYYLLLTHVPHLTKDWYLEQKNRIKLPLEGWTEKHFSPLIISSSLAAVDEWSTSQSKELAEAERTVETKITATEVIASIPIDPESPPISLAVSLPPAYPLESPTVSSRTRVGVSDKNWQSWLRTFSVIIFSQGIVEGLVAFRRNVTGALKGQSECAICYSIIGTDMQTPNKKCQTCKNWFHGSCLFRWFRSSNSSSCPLCRNNFNYA